MSAAIAAVAAIATPTSAPAMLLNEILILSSFGRGALRPPVLPQKTLVGELQADAHDVQVLVVAVHRELDRRRSGADCRDDTLVHVNDVVVDHQANVAVQVPVHAESHDRLAA